VDRGRKRRDGRCGTGRHNQKDGNDARKEALTELRRATRELHGVAARLNARHRLDTEEVRRLRAVLKQGARVRRADAGAIREIAAEYRARAERLEDRLPSDSHEDLEMSESAPRAVEQDEVPAVDASHGTEPPTSGAQAHDARPETSNGGRPSREFRIDELSEEQLALFSERRRLVRLQLEEGKSAAEALEEVDLDCSARSARKYRQRFEEEGSRGLLDGRWLRQPERKVMTDRVQVIAKKWYAGRRAAGPSAIARKVREECRERGLPEPSEPAVRAFLDSLPEIEKLFLRNELDEWDQQGRPVVRVERARRANERWQIDHTTLDLWVRVRRGDEWVPVRPYLTLIIDAYSRSIPGFFLSTAHPDAWSVTLAVRNAVSVKDTDNWFNKGLPQVVQHDQGSDFMSHLLRAWFEDLNVAVDPNPPRYPNATGKIERFFDTLDRGYLRILPGHTDAVGTTEGAAANHLDRLLTREQLKDEITRFIVEDYHQWRHGETDAIPAERWEESMGIPRMPAGDDLKYLLPMYPEERTVTKTGIHFTVDGKGGLYWAPGLGESWKEKVNVRYNPEDMQSVLVYAADTSEYLCEAWIMGREDSKYDIGDVKKDRTQLRRGAKQRTQKYREEVEEQDRRKAQDAEARAIADEAEADAPASDDPAPDDPDVADAMEELERAMGE
jgi:putative transposase